MNEALRELVAIAGMDESSTKREMWARVWWEKWVDQLHNTVLVDERALSAGGKSLEEFLDRKLAFNLADAIVKSGVYLKTRTENDDPLSAPFSSVPTQRRTATMYVIRRTSK